MAVFLLLVLKSICSCSSNSSICLAMLLHCGSFSIFRSCRPLPSAKVTGTNPELGTWYLSYSRQLPDLTSWSCPTTPGTPLGLIHFFILLAGIPSLNRSSSSSFGLRITISLLSKWSPHCNHMSEYIKSQNVSGITHCVCHGDRQYSSAGLLQQTKQKKVGKPKSQLSSQKNQTPIRNQTGKSTALQIYTPRKCDNYSKWDHVHTCTHARTPARTAHIAHTYLVTSGSRYFLQSPLR